MQPPAMGREPFTTPLFVITGGRLLPSRGLHVLQPFLLPASLKTQNSRTVTSRVPWLQQLPGSAARPAPTKQYPHHGAPAQDCWCSGCSLRELKKELGCQEASYSFWEARLGKGPSCHSACFLGSIWPDVCHNKLLATETGTLQPTLHMQTNPPPAFSP